ncbi:adenylyltransferase/cytidyltransferase family protein [Candidatus Uhrbacteria bacterium]|nr:adenylyltransferase/cytidyltransferase family protein [Candidatus Uhrbacteria bacterium]
MNEKKIIAVSGGFDPIHIGHIRMIQEAAALGDELVVIMNNDHWLKKKKGYAFMPEHERKEIIESIAGVARVVLTDHDEACEDRSVCETLRAVRPHVFANGGDRKPDGDPVPEAMLCEELGIEMVYNIGRGGKVQSSSWLTAEDRNERDCFCGSGSKYIDCHGKAA